MWRYSACTPMQTAPFQCVLVKERGAAEHRAHLNDTSYGAVVGIQETPRRIPGFCRSCAYHTWLGKASRSQTLRGRLSTKISPSETLALSWTCLFSSLDAGFLYSCFLVLFSVSFFFIFHCMRMTRWHIGQFRLYCSMSFQLASQRISHATCHAFSRLLSVVVLFFLNFPHKWLWFSLQGIRFEMSVFVVLRICLTFSQSQQQLPQFSQHWNSTRSVELLF